MSTRGLRNFNPSNIKDFGIPWEGLADFNQRTPEQQTETTFCVFRAPWWGIRAMAITLRNYQRKHGLRTVEQIIGRWAPDGDNNPTAAYIRFITNHMNVKRNAELDLESFEDMFPLCQAIVWFENGRNIMTDPYTWEYQTGLILAGIEPSTEYLES